jgi:gamma-glutamyltranspeptidase/glutathione hydrolase
MNARLLLAGIVAIAQLGLAQLACAAGAAPALGKDAIASAHPLATAAGLEVLKAGGNAFDAAIAVSAALAVVEPSGSGIAGGGFYLLHRASDGRNVVIDAREVAPAAATRDMFLDPAGNPVPRLSTDSALAAGIPGEPGGLALLQSSYGKLSIAQNLAPAVRLAREGFAIDARLSNGVERKKRQFLKSKEAERVWFRKGSAAPAGTLIRQPELARTLQHLAQHGMQSFYSGPLAKQLVQGVRGMGGIWTEQDLAGYRALERDPVVGTYRDARVISVPPPSSGGIALIEALNVLSGYDLAKLDGVTRKHLIVEAMRRMHRDRAVYLGDPAFVKIPVALLTSPDYAAGLRTSIRLDRATPSAALSDAPVAAPAGMQTTHFSVLDKDGNRVAATITLNAGFGSGLVVPGTGLILNNQMDDFSMKPGVPNIYGLIGATANQIEPGKRMLSSVSPTFVEGPRGFLITGSPGGSYITGMVLLATLDWLDGKSAEQIVAAPRIHHQYMPDVLQVEGNALAPGEDAELEKLGYRLRTVDSWGNMQAITWDAASGAVNAASDPRGSGAGLVY